MRAPLGVRPPLLGMASFYANVVLFGGDVNEVIGWLRSRRRRAFVHAADRGRIVVFDEHTDSSSAYDLGRFAREISETFRCDALAVGVADTDLAYFFYRSGLLWEEYCSGTAYDWEYPFRMSPAEDHAARLQSALSLDSAAEKELREVLDREMFYDGSGRHDALARVLELPPSSVSLGFAYVVDEMRDGEQPVSVERLDDEDFGAAFGSVN